MKTRILGIALAALCLAPAMLSLVGCNDNTDRVKEDPAKAAASLNAANSIRYYFDKANGKYDNLTADEKTKVNTLMNGEENARKGFSMMRDPNPANAKTPPTG